jgi:predicted hydrocarbon binding protein
MEYEFDEEKGLIYDKVTGDRCIILTKARMHQIISRLTNLFQSGAQVIIGETCKAAGESFAEKVPKQTQADAALFLKTAVQRFTDAGLGKIEVTYLDPEKAELTLRIWNNFFAEIRNDNETTYCNIVMAFVSGIYKRIMGKKADVTETKCIGNGDAFCEWQIKPAE